MLLPGDTVGPWRITETMGTGAMGQVFGAVAADGSRAAVKVLHLELLGCPEAVARLHNEARAARALRHPGIVRILGTGELPLGVPYLVMERLGPSLAARRAAAPSGALAPRAAVRFCAQVARALGAAHAAGIVHRDLKPGNVLFAAPESDRVKVADFGLAKVTAAYRGDDGGVLTAETAVLGTPAYTAPEQWQCAARVTGRADVYSLGILLYELLAGRPPFHARDASALMRMHLYETPPPLPLPAAPGLGSLLDQLLHKDPGWRPPMDEVAAQLVALAAGEGADEA